MPRMDDAVSRNLECPEIPLERLIKSTADRNPKILAEQQRADAAMGDKRDILS